MKIEYKILWVEDDYEWYNAEMLLIKESLEELGFSLTSKHCTNFDEVKEEYNTNQLKNYDILFIDFRLSQSSLENGDKIIEFIRTQNNRPILTTIIFYSSDIETVREKLRENNFEGVYTSLRREFINKAEEVISLGIKRIQEVNTMRGLIMAETSNLDYLMMKIIRKHLQNTKDKNKDAYNDYEEYIRKCISDTISSNKRSFDNTEDIEKVINNTKLFTASHKAKCVNRLNRKEKFYNRYEGILKLRNTFAHVVEDVNKNGEKILKGKSQDRDIIFDENKCIDIRKKLRGFKKELEKILEDINNIQRN